MAGMRAEIEQPVLCPVDVILVLETRLTIAGPRNGCRSVKTHRYSDSRDCRRCEGQPDESRHQRTSEMPRIPDSLNRDWATTRNSTTVAMTQTANAAA